MLIPFALSDFRAFASKTGPAIKTTHKTKPRRPKSERGLSVSQAAFRSPKTREFPRERGCVSCFTLSCFRVPPEREFGDLSTAVCLAQAKIQKRVPMMIAEEVAQTGRSARKNN